MARLDGSSLFSGIFSGLNGTYGQLAQISDGKVTRDSFKNLYSKDNQSNVGYMNPSFVQYMQQNFGQMDKNADGTLAPEEVNDIMNKMAQQGLTREQLTQLASQGGMPSTLLETVMSHFNEIDANKDGKVTNAEISAYGLESDKENAQTQERNRKISSMSTFYGSDSSSVADSGSLLDYKYIQEKKEQ